MASFSSRYAQAFAQVASATQLDSQVALGQMRSFSNLVDTNRELREALTNPSISQEQKIKVIDALSVKLGLAPPVRNFLAVVMSHDRLAFLNEIVQDYSQLADTAAGISEAQIMSAHPLADQDRAELEARVATLAGGRVRTSFTQDPSLLGGAVIKIGSTVYDGSLKTQLAALKEKLLSAQFA